MDTPRIIEKIRELEQWRPTGDESEGELKRRQFDRQKFREVAETVKKLVDLTNTMGCWDQIIAGIVEGLLQSHRYLQSQAVMAIFQALGEFGSLPEEQFTDARNAIAHKNCQLLRERFKEEFFWEE